MIRRIDKELKVGHVEEPEHIAALKTRAADEDDLAEFTEPWVIADDGSRLSHDGTRVVFADGKREPVDEERWLTDESGVKTRRWGVQAIIWPDGRLEVLPDSEWERRFDGAFVKKDRTQVLYADGTFEDFDLEEWEMCASGVMRRKDGMRLIFPEGWEWRFDDPTAHGF